MKLMKLTMFATAAFLLLSAIGCENEETGSMYDPSYTSPRPNPTIASIAPSGSALAAVDTLVITGTNFSATIGENTVYFDAGAASLLSATSTQIRLRSALVTGDNIKIKVGVVGADQFSNTMQYKLVAAVARYGNVADFEAASGISSDASGNLYVAYTSNGVEAGIMKITPAGIRSNYAPATAGVSLWNSIKLGPGGVLFALRNVRAIYSYAAGGGTSATLWTAFPSGVSIIDLDFDQDKNMWAVGNNSAIYRVEPNKTVTSFPFTGNVRAARFYNGYLYFAAETSAGQKIWRAQITSAGLGTPEVYFDFDTAYPAKQVLTMTFSSDGVMYLGTNLTSGIVVVTPSKSHGTPFSAYSGLLGSGCVAFTWGTADDLYASSKTGLFLKTTHRGKRGAPYYGTAQ